VDFTDLGREGPRVSRLGLGTATWGTRTDAADAAEQLRDFLRAGGNLVDTADVYGGGASEEVVGRVLATTARREDVVLATKSGAVTGDKRRRQDASASHLLGALDVSLRRLGTDHVDLWQLHAWDAATPLEETLSALSTAVSSGRALHVGICNYSGWQTAKAAALQRTGNGPPLVSAQVEYSLLERGIEREAVPATADAGLGILAWAPLGRGVLTGKYREGVPERRASSRFFRWYVGPYLDDRAARVVEAVAGAADGLGVAPLAVALSWVRERPGVAAALVGARTAAQLRESLRAEAEAVALPPEVRQRLDEVSAPAVGYPESGL
jgi:aryl-alcohol dehydrogenase-like predicted oxidoreductase